MAANVNHLYNDLRDGLYLLKIEDEVKPGSFFKYQIPF